MHAGLEAVAEVDMQQLPRVPVQHEVAGVAVPQAQEVAHLQVPAPRRRGTHSVWRRVCEAELMRGKKRIQPGAPPRTSEPTDLSNPGWAPDSHLIRVDGDPVGIPQESRPRL